MRNLTNSVLTFALVAMATLALGQPSASAQETVTYNFDVTGNDGATLDGWTDVLGESFPGGVIFSSGGSNDGGRGTGGGGNGTGNQDSSHPNHIMRSPSFWLTATSSIDFDLAGGNRGGTPTNESDISAGTSSGSGYQGLALRRVSDGEYLLFDTRNGDGNGYQAQTAFDAAALAPIFAANMGEEFTLDWVDTYNGSWGFAMIDNVVLNDVFTQNPAAVPEPASVAIWSILGLGLAAFGVYRARRKN
jgi:hypothetical protein